MTGGPFAAAADPQRLNYRTRRSPATRRGSPATVPDTRAAGRPRGARRWLFGAVCSDHSGLPNPASTTASSCLPGRCETARAPDRVLLLTMASILACARVRAPPRQCRCVPRQLARLYADEQRGLHHSAVGTRPVSVHHACFSPQPNQMVNLAHSSGKEKGQECKKRRGVRGRGRHVRLHRGGRPVRRKA